MCASMLFLERGCCRCPTRECGKRGQCIFVALLYHLLALYRRAPAFSVRRRRQIITRAREEQIQTLRAAANNAVRPSANDADDNADDRSNHSIFAIKVRPIANSRGRGAVAQHPGRPSARRTPLASCPPRGSTRRRVVCLNSAH